MRIFASTCIALLLSPNISADTEISQYPVRSLILVEAESGTVLVERNADQRLPPASLTKLMTAYILFGDLRAGRLRLKDIAVVSREAARLPGARMFLNAGESVTIENLLQGMLTQSGNDATRTLVEHVNGKQEIFVGRMNQAVQKLGLSNTHFVNAGGLHHADHYSSARDIATLAVHLRAEFPEYQPWFRQREFTWAGISQPNRNTLLRDPTVDGIKTGHTEAAGFNLALSARRGNTAVIGVMLGTNDELVRARTGKRLLDYAFRTFETRTIQPAGRIGQVPVWYGVSSMAEFGLSRDLKVTLPIASFERLVLDSHAGDSIEAPVSRGQSIGALVARVDGRVIAERSLVLLDDVSASNWVARSFDGLRRWIRGPAISRRPGNNPDPPNRIESPLAPD